MFSALISPSSSSTIKETTAKIFSRNRPKPALYKKPVYKRVKSARVGSSSYKTPIDRFLLKRGSGDGSPAHCSTGNKFDRRASTVWRAFRIGRGREKLAIRFEADDRCTEEKIQFGRRLVPKKGDIR